MALGRTRGGLVRFLAINDVYTLDNLSRLKVLFDTKEREVCAWQAGSDAGVASHDQQRQQRQQQSQQQEQQQQSQGPLSGVAGASPEHAISSPSVPSGVVIKTLAGDFLSPNVLSPIDSGFAFMKCFNEVGISHFCFGNHEANLHINQLEERLRECKGVVMNSNVPTFDRPELPAFDIVQAGDIKLGLLGVVTNEKTVFLNSTFKNYPILDPIEVSVRFEKELREVHGCTHVVALTHQSIGRDRELAQASTINAIIGGHEHTPFDELVNDCRIIKTGKDAEFCGILDLGLSPDGETSVSYHAEPAADYGRDPDIEHLVSVCMDSVRQLGTEIMIDAGHRLSAKGTRFRPTELGMLFGTYIRKELETEVAMINGATIKAQSDFPLGQVSLADLNTVLPFPTKLVTVLMPGSVLQDAVRFSRSNRPWNTEKRGFLQLDADVEIVSPTVSGPYGNAPDDQTADRDTIVSINGKAFEPNRDYLVALPRNLLNGFCEIEPLIQFAQDYPERLPGADVFIPAKDVIVRCCARRVWAQLGEFDQIDLDRDGYVSRSELKQRIHDVIGSSPSEAILDGLIDALDVNRDGIISPSEYARLRKKL
ncbi:Calcium-dependent protein kinase 18 [Hondaea fermentalgiana]|uniref:Calcium-dependent protein kinase 18 n=1 Tax=Hondaea fermentalgiana TaxID=2315210 RepID=A0A2R5G749_9STRA|nr:Calcium-dependent protein kinase 18 [Hondaea fermentalgiana]|eukprot:GBG26355.1 Calcium-dependent protein kinase 18 [Hondaea fermentalgiana]